MERVDFYVLDGSDDRERWRFACRVIDKAFQAEQRVLVWLDATDVPAFDDLLWTFADRAFVPHEPLNAESDWEATPVLLGSERAPASPPDVIINLSDSLPADVAAASRVIEIIDGDTVRRKAGRERFRQYRAQGIEPQTHNLGDRAE